MPCHQDSAGICHCYTIPFFGTKTWYTHAVVLRNASNVSFVEHLRSKSVYAWRHRMANRWSTRRMQISGSWRGIRCHNNECPPEKRRLTNDAMADLMKSKASQMKLSSVNEIQQPPFIHQSKDVIRVYLLMIFRLETMINRRVSCFAVLLAF